MGDLGGAAADSLGDLRGVAVYTLGDYWRPDRDERTDLGELVHRAKDLADPGAAGELSALFAGLAGLLPEAVGGQPRLVAPLPSAPVRAGDDSRPNLAEPLAASLAAAGAGEYRSDLLAKTKPTPRLRHVDPEHRPEVAASAGYRVCEPVAGHHIVVVDDVVMTGSTLNAVAACLRDAGASSVTAAVAARTRLR